jgi:hypothetical protein
MRKEHIYRQAKHWRWPGVKPLNVLYAAGSIVLIFFFLYSASPLFPVHDNHFLPWYLGGLGIGIFGILQTLKVVDASQVEFVSHCMVIDQYGRELEPAAATAPPQITGPAWKRTAKVVYSVVFILVWVAGVASFYFSGTAFKNGSPQPTATQTQPLTDHGKTVYVTPAEKQRLDELQLAMWIGIPFILVGGAVLHFLLGVKVFGGNFEGS